MTIEKNTVLKEGKAKEDSKEVHQKVFWGDYSYVNSVRYSKILKVKLYYNYW